MAEEQELEERDCEEQELQGLLLQVQHEASKPTSAAATENSTTAGSPRSRQRASLWICLPLVILVSLLLCWRPDREVARQEETRHVHPLFTCPPANTTTVINGDDEHSYHNVSQQILTNATAYFHSFRERAFDDWNTTYRDFKQSMYDWKRRHYMDLQDNGSIYESACGIGLNLYMTLEILSEVKDLQNVTVYGNEYVSESVQVANLLLQELDWPGNARRGAICNGDSTSLNYVPSNSFDLVFTGYITPLLDPLELNQSTDDVYLYLANLCFAPDSDRESKRLLIRIQKLQEAWYAKWVMEMVRIAKPGAPVIVEQVSYPLCRALRDWGGVSPDFWKRSVDEWDVDPESLDMERDRVFEGMLDRYHVFMRKNGSHPSS